MNALRSLVVVGVAVLAAACGGGIPGSGTSKTEVREVGAFHRVEVSGALEVTLTDRDPGTVSVSTDDNLLEYLSTTVTDGVLKVEPKDGARLLCVAPLKIEVSWKTLDEAGASGASKISSAQGIACDRVALAASGASLIELDAVAGNEVVIWASGASRVSLREASATKGSFQISGASQLDVKSGHLTSIEADVSGSSSVSLGALSSDAAALTVSGASDVKLTASKSVTGTVSGASSVAVKGSPEQRGLGTSGGSRVQFD